eukprot:3827192-Pyramimonas_sp.AAC.1
MLRARGPAPDFPSASEDRRVEGIAAALVRSATLHQASSLSSAAPPQPASVPLEAEGGALSSSVRRRSDVLSSPPLVAADGAPEP